MVFDSSGSVRCEGDIGYTAVGWRNEVPEPAPLTTSALERGVDSSRRSIDLGHYPDWHYD